MITGKKNTIEFFLKQLTQNKTIEGYETEMMFAPGRRFRFDWAIPSLKIAIEYNGLVYSSSQATTGRSGHQTIGGIKADNEKSNLAVTLGWQILVYTAMNYMNCFTDIEKIINNRNTK